MIKSTPSKSNISMSKAGLNQFDFSVFEENDPGFLDGFTPIFE